MATGLEHHKQPPLSTHKIFEGAMLRISPSTHRIQNVESGFKIVHLDPELIKEYEQKREELKDLHPGELTSILLCRRENMAFVTNDSKAKKFCKKNGIEWLDIIDIFRLCYRKHLFDKREIEI